MGSPKTRHAVLLISSLPPLLRRLVLTLHTTERQSALPRRCRLTSSLGTHKDHHLCSVSTQLPMILPMPPQPQASLLHRLLRKVDEFDLHPRSMQIDYSLH
jgi:hypothetical protein